MGDKFKNKYRIASARAQWWDYGWEGAYFITICTHDRICWFGEVVNGAMQLSVIGRIVEMEWLKTFELRPDMNLIRGEYVVMPNHFHAIIGIGENIYNAGMDGGMGGGGRDAMHRVSTPAPAPQNQFGPQSKNLASIIRGFKSAVTQQARLISPDYAWQPRFHDHIIRDEAEFQRISNYIIANPEKWDEDRFFYGK